MMETEEVLRIQPPSVMVSATTPRDAAALASLSENPS
jgi:hypothetical protein